MHRLTLILALVVSSTCAGQGRENFIIKEFINKDSIPKPTRINTTNKVFFEDSLFIVTKTCSGEWGGTIKFKDKKTDIEYVAASTCPVVVNKLNNKYYVTNTLAHMSGFSEVLEIADPKAMTIIKPPKPKTNKIETATRYTAVGDDESKAKKGTRQLLDSIGVLTVATFPFQDKLYHIVTDHRKTYLAKITNGKYETIKLVSNEPLWTYDPIVYSTIDNHYIVFFNNRNTKGYYDIYKNTITVVRQK